MMNKEQEYRIIDALYRIHEDIFHVEDVLIRYAKSSLSATKARTNTTIGSFVGGLLVIVPILNAILGINWSSTPAVVIYVISFGLILLWIYQIISAHRTAKKLGLITKPWQELPLESRHDYLLEVVATWGIRCRVINEVLEELESHIAVETDLQKKPKISEKIERFKENKNLSLDWIKFAVNKSEYLLKKSMRTDEEHKEIEDWANPFKEELKLREEEKK